MYESHSQTIAVLGIIGSFCAPFADAQKIYWTDAPNNRIWRANLNGAGVEVVLDTGPGPMDIVLDVDSGKMYWTENSVDRIRRANLDGSGVEDLVTEGLTFLRGLALDTASGKMYWTNENMIQRANLDGTGVETIATPGYFVYSLEDLAVDLNAKKMYWIDGDFEWDWIERSNLDGSEVEVIVPKLLASSSVWAIALDLEGERIYWTSNSEGSIQRANLDGSDREVLIAPSAGRAVYGIAIDSIGSHMYWNENIPNELGTIIRRANLDATGMETILTNAESLPFGMIALDLRCCRLYGDIYPPVDPPGDCYVDVDDLVCVVAGYGDMKLCPSADIEPCGGDGDVDVDELVALFAAYAGIYACPSPCPP
jgi:sugar lactone lactonase YvrE